MSASVLIARRGFRLALATVPILASLALGAEANAPAARGEKTHEVSLANGLVMAHTGAEHLSTLVMKRKPDGSIVYQCVHGLLTAENLLKEDPLKKDANAAQHSARKPALSQSKNDGRGHDVR